MQNVKAFSLKHHGVCINEKKALTSIKVNALKTYLNSLEYLATETETQDRINIDLIKNIREFIVCFFK